MLRDQFGQTDHVQVHVVVLQTVFQHGAAVGT